MKTNKKQPKLIDLNLNNQNLITFSIIKKSSLKKVSSQSSSSSSNTHTHNPLKWNLVKLRFLQMDSINELDENQKSTNFNNGISLISSDSI